MKSLNQAIFETTYAWLLENGCKPYIRCFSEKFDFIKTPALRAQIRKLPMRTDIAYLTLNISPKACEMVNTPEYLIFRCRVNGVKCEEFIPWENIKLMYDSSDTETVIEFPGTLIKDNEQHSQQSETQPTQPKAGVIPKFGLIVGGKE